MSITLADSVKVAVYMDENMAAFIDDVVDEFGLSATITNAFSYLDNNAETYDYSDLVRSVMNIQDILSADAKVEDVLDTYSLFGVAF